MSCLNPAIGFSTVLVMVFNSNSEGMKRVWLYGIFPFIGGLIAVFFHELVYKKVQDTINEHEEEDDGDGLLDKIEQE
jgi:TRAP-type C4-dicarboxylate transport system permease small subunit